MARHGYCYCGHGHRHSTFSGTLATNASGHMAVFPLVYLRADRAEALSDAFV